MQALIGLPPTEIHGQGIFSSVCPGVPAIQSDDMLLDPAFEYARAELVGNADVLPWVRRAAHFEAFAKALESELRTSR